MSDRSKTFPPPICAATRNTTSSQASVPGHMRSAWRAGLMKDPSGPEAAHANLSARQAKEQGLLMSGTYGRPGTGSLSSIVLTASLESKLRVKTASLGSTLYRMTWKVKATPLRRLYSQLAAQVLRTKEKDFGSWPTPQLSDMTGGGQAKRVKGRSNLNDHVLLASWATPAAREPGGTPEQFLKRKEKHPCGQSVTALSLQVQFASWATPRTNSHTGRGTRGTGGENLQTQAQLAVTGQMPNGSTAQTEGIGQLNPAHSRWLIGLPIEWDVSADTAMQSFRKSPLK
jgi:hypothetical protein